MRNSKNSIFPDSTPEEFLGEEQTKIPPPKKRVRGGNMRNSK